MFERENTSIADSLLRFSLTSKQFSTLAHCMLLFVKQEVEKTTIITSEAVFKIMFIMHSNITFGEDEFTRQNIGHY